MKIELTRTSAAEREVLLSGRLTPETAAKYLRDGEITLRSFADTLKELYPREDLQQRLCDAFEADEPEADRDSVRHKVRGWLSGRNKPARREDIFRIAFALGLSEAQVSALLGQCTGYGIHYRDGRDVVYAWFLRNGRGLGEARAFFDTLPPVPTLDNAPPADGTQLSREVQNAFMRPADTEQLRECYISNLERFGALHLCAYKYFCSYLNQLTQPATAWGGEGEPVYSLDRVMELYLTLNMPSGRERGKYTLVQRLIKREWPNTTSLKNIRARKEDVPRKLLLLLYVITENVTDAASAAPYEGSASLERRLDDHWWTLNGILAACGMPLLDPRSPTDWLILYAMTADEDEPMSDRMAQVIERLFEDG